MEVVFANVPHFWIDSWRSRVRNFVSGWSASTTGGTLRSPTSASTPPNSSTPTSHQLGDGGLQSLAFVWGWSDDVVVCNRNSIKLVEELRCFCVKLHALDICYFRSCISKNFMLPVSFCVSYQIKLQLAYAGGFCWLFFFCTIWALHATASMLQCTEPSCFDSLGIFHLQIAKSRTDPNTSSFQKLLTRQIAKKKISTCTRLWTQHLKFYGLVH